MTLAEIKTEICDLRCSVEGLQEQAQELWRTTEDKETENVAGYLDNELGYVAYRLSELEDTETDTEGDTDPDELEYKLDYWWDGLDNETKSQLVGIPTPSRNDSAGEYDFKEFCEKWWNAKTIAQKQEIYQGNVWQ